MSSLPYPHLPQISQSLPTKKHTHARTWSQSSHSQKKKKTSTKNSSQNSTKHLKQASKFNSQKQNCDIKQATDLVDVTVGIPVANKICHSMWEIHRNATTLYDRCTKFRTS